MNGDGLDRSEEENSFIRLPMPSMRKAACEKVCFNAVV
jgi:hypothetical protein